jgi:hypothetical protein
MVATENGWIIGDASPPSGGMYSCPKPAWLTDWEGEEYPLEPVKLLIDMALPSPGAPARCQLTRLAAASYAQSVWGPKRRETPWKPTASRWDPARAAIEALLTHSIWGGLDVVGSLLHLALPRHQAAVTLDLVTRSRKDGLLSAVSIWSGPHPRINPNAPWADLGAAVAALADGGIPIARAGLIWVNAEGVSFEVRQGAEVDDVVATWLDVLDCRPGAVEARHRQAVALQAA